MADTVKSRGKRRKIAAAAGTTSSAGRIGLGGAIEAAMAAATEACFAEGITDPDVIRERKLLAREEVKAEANKEAIKAAEAERARLLEPNKA